MITFLLFFLISFTICLIILFKNKKPRKEIILFITIAMLGFADWISIITRHNFNPNKWIGIIIDQISFW
ncbi:hypothetical protein [Shimazuella kribbensis]|uniref:hypothetical protein n=1 Tax=Shimazuella kribbensis TaxID=139808 RepID=UPI000405D4E5|nr:hypothetical protein [Shimazuella kribbensis]